MSELQPISPREFPWFRYSDYSFSLGVTDGSTAWLSGHSASEYDPESRHIVVRGGMGEQAKTAYAKIAKILEAAGMDFTNVVRLVENVVSVGVESYTEAVEVRQAIFKKNAPAVVTVIVDRLLRPQALIEIEVIASRGAGHDSAGASDLGLRRARIVEASDGTIYLPTVLPIDSSGNIVADGDFAGQYRYCLERAAELLGRVGFTLSNVVKTVDYSTPETREVYRYSGRPRKELLGPIYPGSAGILMERMHAPGVLVSIDVTASRHPLSVVNPGWSRYETLSYSPGVKAGKMLFMSGFAALDPGTQEAVHPGNIVAQAEYTYESIRAVLEAAGASVKDLVKTIEYVCPEGLAEYREVGLVRKRLLSEPWPASTGIVCHSLLRPEFRIEIDPMAVIQ